MYVYLLGGNSPHGLMEADRPWEDISRVFLSLRMC